MSDYISLTTVAEVRKAIRKAKHVFAEVRIGTMQRAVAVSKKEALGMFSDMLPGEHAVDYEAYASAFASTSRDGYTIWIG